MVRRATACGDPGAWRRRRRCMGQRSSRSPPRPAAASDARTPPETQPGAQPGAQPTAQAFYALPAPPDSVGALQQRLGELQQRLRALGFYDGSVDATAGPKTELAIKAFQHAAGLKVHAGAARFSFLLMQVE